MIVYENTLGNFIDDVVSNEIADEILEMFRLKGINGGSPREIMSWNNSLRVMKDVLNVPYFPMDCKVALEYNIPQTSKRVDFMILGSDENKKDHIVIIELKQWGKVQKIDDESKHSVKADLRDCDVVAHPSYQVFTYKKLIGNYCDEVTIPESNLNPCAYLHNMGDNFRTTLEDDLYSDWVEEAPIFLKHDTEALRKFIRGYITAKAQNGDLLYKIDYGKIKPQKALQDSIDSMLCGNEEFHMVDEQAVAFDIIMKAVRKGLKDDKKHVVIVSGGPGTGKSVLAINVLAECICRLGVNASYITKNSAPRNCYKKLLTKGNAKKEVDLKKAICSPFVLPFAMKNGIDVGIFDEAHRMQKSPYMYKGNDMLFDALRASKISIFFVDDDQRITVNDCYSVDKIYEYANEMGAIIDTPTPFVLESQFRCNGSDAYIAFLQNMLGIKKTANIHLSDDEFELKVFDNPNQMRDVLRIKNSVNNKSRMVAGYCYDWDVKHGRDEYDIKLEDGFKAKWNLATDETFAISDGSFEQVGCIHTVQGMEFDYVGVIIGKDLIYRDGKVITNRAAISKDDKTSGIRSCRDDALADRLIRNTYKVLLTRGQKGCYIYCEDIPLREYIKSLLK